MKKIGKIKRIGLTATVFILCLAMLITCFTFARPMSMRVFADEPVTAETGNVTLGTGLNIQNEVEYGKEITVPAGVKVTAPNGDVIEAKAAESKVVANQMGIYKLTYADDSGKVSYDFNVKVTFEKDYFLWVEGNGADIPTYVEKNKGFNLPAAYLMYYNDDNVLTEYPGNDVIYKVEDSLGALYSKQETEGKVTFGEFKKDQNGKVFITYSAKIGGAAGTKFYTKTFTVNVQSTVNYNSNPKLSVSGVQSDASINRPVTLPVAKATDTNDDNVRVEIEVIGPDGKTPVNNVDVNDDGYAYNEHQNDPVKFDNDKSMTFYPTVAGDYKVRYTAYSDAYLFDNTVGKSGTNEFNITVADHVAPVFKNVDEYLIPETWGKNVTDKDGKEVEMQNKIKFTVPTVVDNKDKVDGDENNAISLYFRITDSDNSRTVVEFKNILSDKDNKISANDTYKNKDNAEEKEFTFSKEDGFVFNFDYYQRKDKKGEEMSSKAGTYTVLYRARDKANNTSSKTYTVTFKEEYEDKADPSSAEVSAPEYLSAADESFTVPYPVYSDANDTRPQLVYRMYTDAAITDNYLDIEGGEEAKLITKTGGKRFVVINEGKENEAELELNDNLYFYVYVQDKVGNFKSNAVKDGEEIALKDLNDVTTISAVTKIVKETTENFGYNANIKFVNDENGSDVITAGDTVNAGRFAVTTANYDMRAFTGFEVSVVDPNGNPVGVTLETVTVSDKETKGPATIYVQNIAFMAAVATTDKPYTMTIRVFDVHGKSDVYGYTLMGVNAKAGNDNETQSAIPSIGTTGSVNTKYKLHNEVIKGIPEGKFYVARKISGGTFSLMGSEFTALTQGSYSVQDGYIADEKIKTDAAFDFANDVNFGGASEGVYNFTVTDEAAPVVELQDTMPSYKEKDAEVTLPKAIAYTENGMGKVEIEVKDPDSYDVDLTETKDGNKTFKATKDGAYTVTYTATYKNATPATVTYTINVGDVFAPVFTTKGGTNTSGTKKEGDVFKFAKFELVEEESTTGITVTKEIYDPSGDIMSSHTVSGSFAGYADKENNGSEIKLSKVGDYKIVYTVKDAVGNEYQLTDKVTVASQGSSSPTTWTTLSTVLIIVAIVLLAGVIIYVVRFRKVKK